MKNIITENELNELVNFRKFLHKHPELSNHENETVQHIKEMILKTKPDHIIEDIGGKGIAFVFEGAKSGPTVMFRAELDALPIPEENHFGYKSLNKGISHKCGHDGHMSILVGLAKLLSKTRPANGKVILLFQPAEETGEGAERVLRDKRFKTIAPDFVFAIHNLPGYNNNEIIIKEDCFSAASTGMIIRLYGKESHAGHPENGNSPALAVADIIKKMNEASSIADSQKYGLVTIINVEIGNKSFGTAPGFGEVLVTLRAYSDEHLLYLKSKCIDIVNFITKMYQLKVEYDWTEYFPATINHNEANDFITKAAKISKLNIFNKDEPFRWSEDFGHFTNLYPGAMFGLGAGIETPQLHNPDYDFPDDIMTAGIKMFNEITRSILG